MENKVINISVSSYEYAMGDGFVIRDSEELELAILKAKVEALTELLNVEFKVTLTRPERW